MNLKLSGKFLCDLALSALHLNEGATNQVAFVDAALSGLVGFGPADTGAAFALLILVETGDANVRRMALACLDVVYPNGTEMVNAVNAAYNRYLLD